MILIFITITLLASAAAIAVFLLFLGRGQFDDAEDIKYQLFREEEDAEIPQSAERR